MIFQLKVDMYFHIIPVMEEGPLLKRKDLDILIGKLHKIQGRQIIKNLQILEFMEVCISTKDYQLSYDSSSVLLNTIKNSHFNELYLNEKIFNFNQIYEWL